MARRKSKKKNTIPRNSSVDIFVSPPKEVDAFVEQLNAKGLSKKMTFVFDLFRSNLEDEVYCILTFFRINGLKYVVETYTTLDFIKSAKLPHDYFIDSAERYMKKVEP